MPAREKRLAEILARERGELVHPFDDARIIAGQGTAALELLAEIPTLDVISTPVGGGGSDRRQQRWPRKRMAPRIRVVGAEPEQADDAYQSFRSGERRAVVAPNTIADGLRGSIGVRNFELLRRHVDDVVTVSEAQIVAAMRIVLAGFQAADRAVVGGAGRGRARGQELGAPGQRIGIVLSGGNVDLELCPFLRGETLQLRSRM